MLLGAITALISTLVGYVFAYALTRTAIPFKGFFKAIATIPVISPPFVLSLSMIFLFGRNGLITKKTAWNRRLKCIRAAQPHRRAIHIVFPHRLSDADRHPREN